MRHHQVLLELRQLVLVHGNIAERAKTGGHAIDRRLLVLHALIKIVTALCYSIFCFFPKVQHTPGIQQSPDLIQ